MNTSVQSISLASLLIVSVPVLVVIGFYLYWSLDTKNALYAFARMLVQLLLIGYVLKYIFEADQSWIVVLVLSVMLLMASWISLRTIKARRIALYHCSLLSICIGGVSTLAIVTQGVLRIQPWFWPQYMIPLAGMIFANAMTSISLAADRLIAEQDRGGSYETARRTAMQTALIPNINALFAVGLVSLPGMMTGQILSGVSPLIAARYQIMVMCMIFGSSGISVAIFLILARNKLEESGKESMA